MAINSGSHVRTRQLFMWSMACVYMFAFISLYTQIPGLYGSRGLTPVHNIIPKLKGDVSLLDQFWQFPSVLVFHSLFQLPPSVAMELCCLVGGALALLMMLFRAMRCTVMFAILWLLYLSLHKVGQVFMWFQWDSSLLEAGFLTILVAPFNLFYWRKTPSSSSDGLMFWLARFLLFRLMFAAGVVKLTSQCPTWWGLTALNFHYETQCIPTPLSWYAHQLPEWFQRLSVVGVFVIEIVMPLLFFLPVRSLRLLGFISQVLLQVLIILTGNYNFFNLLTIVLSLSLIDDRFLGYVASGAQRSFSRSLLHSVFGAHGSLLASALRKLAFLSTCGLLVALTIFYFDLRVDLESWSVVSNTNFSSKGFSHSLSVAVALTAVMAAMSLAVEIVSAFIESLSQRGVLSKFFSLFNTTVFSGVAVAMFSVALVSHGVLDSQFQQSIPQNVRSLHDWMDQVSVTSPYGLFRKMTGVGGRPEVIIEGTNGDPDREDWKEYDFLYKPGNLNDPPAFVAPHQPRLDWQMWFAALGHYTDNPWLVNLVYKLLVGEKDVLQLMATPPFSSPPKYIRARLYHYHFTPYDLRRPINNQTDVWWQRTLNSEYLYALTKENDKLQEYLTNYNFLHEPNTSHYQSPLLPSLSYLRDLSQQLSPPVLLWALFLTALSLTLTSFLICPDRDHTHQRTAKVDITEYLAEMQGSDDEQETKVSVSPKSRRGPYRRNKQGKQNN